MWRVQALVGRVLHRYHGSNSLRLPQNHHVEDEFISSSVVLSTSRQPPDSSSQKAEDGERKKKQRSFHFGTSELPRYTAMDAMGWGAATVLFMQICRRIHSQFSSSTEPNPTPGALTAPSSLQRCGYRILLEILSRRNVLPVGSRVSCLPGVQERLNQDQSASTSSNSSRSSCQSSSDGEHPTTDSSISDQQGEILFQDSSIPEESLLSACFPHQNDTNQNNTELKISNKEDLSDEERLVGATLNLRHVGETSVPVILNIIGLESAKRENYEEAFTCFLAAAQQGYSKAQFNTAVCYEKGRGVSKNKDKALYYYKQAAVGGHKQAQYRYAKLVLTSRGQQSLEELKTAIDLLEEAAAAGLTKAQVCLASVYSQDPVRYGGKPIQYLQMAAESGDGTALLLLGQCYERGFGVQQNFRVAVDFYKRAAEAGNKQARRLLTPPHGTDSKEDAALRSIRSAPFFSAADLRFQQSLSSLATQIPWSISPLLPHSWSTGSLFFPLSSTPTHLHPTSTESAACQWTVGVG